MSGAVKLRPYLRPALVVMGCLFWAACLAGAWEQAGGRYPFDAYLRDAYLLSLFGIPAGLILLTLLCGWCVVRARQPGAILLLATFTAMLAAAYWLLLWAGNSV